MLAPKRRSERERFAREGKYGSSRRIKLLPNSDGVCFHVHPKKVARAWRKRYGEKFGGSLRSCCRTRTYRFNSSALRERAIQGNFFCIKTDSKSVWKFAAQFLIERQRREFLLKERSQSGIRFATDINWRSQRRNRRRFQT
jgi:hypothetical protein